MFNVLSDVFNLRGCQVRCLFPKKGEKEKEICLAVVRVYTETVEVCLKA